MPSEKAHKVALERKIDKKLWETVRHKSSGDEKDRNLAVDLIRENYWQLPEEVNYILKNLSQSEQPESVRLRIAQIIESGKHNFPIGFYFELIKTMRDDPNAKIREIMTKEEKRWAELFSSFKVVYKQIAESLQQDITPLNLYFKNIVEGISPHIRDIAKVVKLPQLSFSLYEPIYRVSEELHKQISESFQLYYPKIYFEQLVIPEEVPEKTMAFELIQKLVSCPRGREGWRQYQEVCKEILSYLFVPPLGELCEQSRTESGLHIRDYILHIPYAADGFWAFCKAKYDSVGLLVECKDYTKEISPNDVVITAKYLTRKGLGCFGILLNREEPPPQVIEQTLNLWRNESKLIIVLDDQALVEMIKLKEEGKDPEIILDMKIFDLRKRIA